MNKIAILIIAFVIAVDVGYLPSECTFINGERVCMYCSFVGDCEVRP